MKNVLSVSFSLKLLRHLLSLEYKLELSSDNSPVELTSISCAGGYIYNPKPSVRTQDWVNGTLVSLCHVRTPREGMGYGRVLSRHIPDSTSCDG